MISNRADSNNKSNGKRNQNALWEIIVLNKMEVLLCILAFAFFFYMAMNKLMATPLWLDETLEYYISKYMTGEIPWYSNNGIMGTTNMYQRMLGGFQPPLYNFLMYFWIAISDTEWWFRIWNVVMSAIAAIGIYKTVKKVSTYRVAALSVIVYSSIYEVIYYTQECSEYSMLLMAIAWLLYFYFKLFQNISLKNMIWFAVFCCIAMYTQYGAAFVVVPLLLSILIRVLKTKQAVSIKQLMIVYAVTFFVAAVPLIVFFLIPQMENQVPSSENVEAWNFYNNSVLQDFIHMFVDVFRWNTIESITRFFYPALAASIGLLVTTIFCCIISKDKLLKHLLVCNAVTWILYYIPTRAGIYARGYFGFRYNIFFIPLWLITILYMMYEVYLIMGRVKNVQSRKNVQRAYCILMAVLAAGYCIYGTHQINKRWEKADTRGCVQAWYDAEGYQIPTFVEINQAPSFSYYFEHDDRYRSDYEQNIYREENQIGYAESQYEEEYAEYEQYLDTIFGEEYPDEMYLFIGNKNESRLFNVLEDRGYTIEEVYKTTAQLYYAHK